MRSRSLLILLCTNLCLNAAELKNPAISLNSAALEFARRLIKEGRVVADRKGAWRRDRPSSAQENDFIRARGLEEYGKWHLGIDNRHSARTKSYYKFPFGDFNVLHRCGLLAVKARAHEYGYFDIEAAAGQLLAELEFNRPRR
jgi:hypothetical protein